MEPRTARTQPGACKGCWYGATASNAVPALQDGGLTDNAAAAVANQVDFHQCDFHVCKRVVELLLKINHVAYLVGKIILLEFPLPEKNFKTF